MDDIMHWIVGSALWGLTYFCYYFWPIVAVLAIATHF